MKIGFVLLPGAGMSNWLWKYLLPLLELPGISISPRLRENTQKARLNASFSDIVNYHLELIDQSDFEKIILVGHSGAGLLAGTLGKVSKKVCHVVFIAANIPRDGTTAIQVLPPEVQKQNIDGLNAQVEFDRIPIKNLENMFVNVFGNRCSLEQIEYVLGQDYIPEPLCVLNEKMAWENYPELGKTYIICTSDKTLTEKQQEYLASNLSISDIRRIDSAILS